jgi:hypothetical protein
MSNKFKLNLNVNKDDQSINDFLQVWESLNSRPSKTNIFKTYDHQSFDNYFKDKFLEKYVQRDVIPFEDEEIINERFLCKISDRIWMTYTTYDSSNEESFVGELSFLYDYNCSEKLQLLIDDIEEFVLTEQSEIAQENNLFSIIVNQNGFDLEDIKKSKFDTENIEDYYNDDVLKSLKKMSKKLSKSVKGLSIVFGERGTGKTSTIHYLSNKLKDKNFLYLPGSLFEMTLNNPEFRTFLKKNKNNVLILDDCELFFSDIYSKSNILSNNLLQLVDGLDSDNYDLNLILILNCEDVNDIDQQILSCNNLNDVVQVTPLKKTKINALCKSLGKKNKYENPTKLIDILRTKFTNSKQTDLGFE